MFLRFLLTSPSASKDQKRTDKKHQVGDLKVYFHAHDHTPVINIPKESLASGICMDNDMQNLVMNRIILKKNIKKPLGLTINFKIGI
jgi:hypothetical protein